MASLPFSILMVCTGNVCRSPFAEALLRRRLAGSDVVGVEVRSRGTMALVGAPVAAEMLPEFARFGLSPDGLAGAQLDQAAAVRADLIVTMSKRQRAWIIEEWPEVGLRTVMLTSTGALADSGASADSPPGVGAEAHRAGIRAWARSGAQLSAADVLDPYGRSPEVARRSADVIRGHVAELGRWLGTGDT